MLFLTHIVMQLPDLCAELLSQRQCCCWVDDGAGVFDLLWDILRRIPTIEGSGTVGVEDGLAVQRGRLGDVGLAWLVGHTSFIVVN